MKEEGRWERGKGKTKGRGSKGKGEKKGKVEGRQLKKSRMHARTDARKHGHSSDFILCPMLFTSLKVNIDLSQIN